MLIKAFLFLLIPFVLWSAVLQSVVKPAMSGWPLGMAIGIYVLPPAVVWTIWMLLRMHAARRSQVQEGLRSRAEADRLETERNAARQRHEEELRQRRLFCDCRAIAAAVARLGDDLSPAPPPPNVQLDELDFADPLKPGDAILDRLQPAIANVLASTWSFSAAAALFPVYVVPPPDAPGAEVLALVRRLHAELLASLGTPGLSAACAAPVLFLPVSDNVGNGILSLFENDPDLAGATILAFDSPLSRCARDQGDDAIAEGMAPHDYPNGVPNEGAVALLVTNAALRDMFQSVPAAEHSSLENTAMTPFWERSGEHPAILARMDAGQREELMSLPLLGRIHRAASAVPGSICAGILETTRVFQGALETAQIDCGLIDKPFTLEESPQDNGDRQGRRLNCGRLVHNAGHAGNGGKRLAALGSAMLYFGIDFSPVDRDVATNVITCLGDLGCASGVAQLALCITRAAGSGLPALCVEFTESDGAAVSIVMPTPVAS